ncbi:restriction endonuclease subunit S [Ruminococcus bromii]|uniref:restriction endonuclease subunit S n=1 Tax=Ruminococcus bromii TaxID=40518 RepID=UPI003FD79EB3
MKFNRYALYDLATIKYGKNQKKVLSESGNIPIYGTGGLMGYATTALYDKPSVLIGRKGTIGKVKYVEHPFWTVDTLFYTIVNTDIVLPKYLYYVMSLIDLNNYNEGTTIPSLRTETLNRLEFDIPSLVEQETILSCLNPIDEKIALNNAINNNLEQQAVLLFKKWFIEFDNSSKNMLETRFGLVPESFKLLKNGELPLVVTDYVANGSFASLKANVTLYQEPNYAYFIRNTDLKSGTFEVFVDEHSYNFLSKSTLYGGEIIISNVGDVGSVFLCPKLDKPMTLGNNIIMLRPEQENLRYYLYIWFKWLYGQSLIQGIKGGSAQPKFNKTDFKNLPIFLPPDDLLEQFHQIVKPMFELIDENNTENQALTRTRDTLLPKLMSGELDVSDIDL